MNKLDNIPKDILYRSILDTTLLNKSLNKDQIKLYLYILNKNYFNDRIKEKFYNYFNNIENKNGKDYQNFINTVLKPFLNEYIINYDIPYTSTDEEYIINQVISQCNNKSKV